MEKHWYTSEGLKKICDNCAAFITAQRARATGPFLPFCLSLIVSFPCMPRLTSSRHVTHRAQAENDGRRAQTLAADQRRRPCELLFLGSELSIASMLCVNSTHPYARAHSCVVSLCCTCVQVAAMQSPRRGSFPNALSPRETKLNREGVRPDSFSLEETVGIQGELTKLRVRVAALVPQHLA